MRTNDKIQRLFEHDLNATEVRALPAAAPPSGKHQAKLPPEPRVELRRLLDVDELAALLNVTRRHIYRLVHEKRIPYLKIGGLLRFDPAQIAAWLKQAECPAIESR